MQVYLLNTIDELARYADQWDRLADGVPFRSWGWLSAWWRHYGHDDAGRGPRRHLFVPCVFDESDRLVGLAPWYCEAAAVGGHVLRMLGSGEVCSDYLGILSEPGRAYAVADVLAEFLTTAALPTTASFRWDALELANVDATDQTFGWLAEHCAGHGCAVDRRPGVNCWRLNLPTTWEGYLDRLSKQRAAHARRLLRRYVDSGRATLHLVERREQLPDALAMFIDMHQRRRQSLGQAGCFASPKFRAFFADVAEAMLVAGRSRFFWLAIDDRPVAVEYVLAGDGLLYAYQAAIEPDALKHEPGKVICYDIVRQAIAQGYRAMDFLRGDEPYKAHLGAVPRPNVHFRIAPDRPVARWRHGVWLAGLGMKGWIKRSLRRVAARR